MLLYVIRHGEPIYNPDTLTPLGFQQAEALGHYFASVGLDAVYSSPNGRARQTAEPTCKALGLTMEIEPWTSEDLAWNSFHVEDEKGAHWIFSKRPAADFRSDGLDKAPYDDWLKAPGMERLADPHGGMRRIIDASDVFLRKLGYEREGGVYRIREANEKRIAVFCHGGFSSFWFSHLLNIPPHIFWSGFTIAHSAITKIFFANVPEGVTVPRCIELAATPHLYKDNVEVKDASYGV